MKILKVILFDVNDIKRRNPNIKNISFKDILYLLLTYTGYARILVRIRTNFNNRFLKFTIKIKSRKKYLIEINDDVEIGSVLKLSHTRNIILAGTKIGYNVQINQNVTIGSNNKNSNT